MPVANHKTEGPSTCVTFLGITIDTTRLIKAPNSESGTPAEAGTALVYEESLH